jgi:hypothetical protein
MGEGDTGEDKGACEGADGVFEFHGVVICNYMSLYAYNKCVQLVFAAGQGAEGFGGRIGILSQSSPVAIYAYTHTLKCVASPTRHAYQNQS